MSVLRIAFMGTPDFALPALAALHESDHEVVCVYTQPPRPKGRGQKLQKSPVHDYAEKHGIEVRTPKSLKKEEAQQEFTALNLDVAVVAAYGLILPKAVLDAPKHGCLNIHASLLPRWRGASPIQRAIWEGDSETGVTIMQMDEGLDTGAMIAKRVVPITSGTTDMASGVNDTASSLHDELCKIGERLVLEVIGKLASGEQLEAEAQDDAQSTYAKMLTKEDGRVNWSQNAQEIDRQIRALNPWPGVWSENDGARLKILEAHVTPISDYPDHIGSLCGEGDPAGMILSKDGFVICGGRTILQLTKVQPAGAKAMDFVSALNGGYIKLGDILS